MKCFSEETKRRMSIAHKGKHLSKEAREKLSIAMRGERNPLYGKRLSLSEETRRRMSIAHKGKRISDSQKQCISETLKGHSVSEETRNKLRAAFKGRTLSQETRMKMSVADAGRIGPMRGKHHSETVKNKIAKALKGRTLSDIQRRHISQGHKGMHLSASHRLHLSEGMSKKWQNPEFVKKMIQGFHHRPTSLETKVATILDKYFPRQFAYNGDFSLGIAIGGQIPDFVNVNGKKQIIEVFGDYWHSQMLTKNRWKVSELGKIMIYNSLGYDCLVLWQKDIKKQPEVEIANTIKSFVTKRRRG